MTWCLPAIFDLFLNERILVQSVVNLWWWLLGTSIQEFGEVLQLLWVGGALLLYVGSLRA